MNPFIDATKNGYPTSSDINPTESDQVYTSEMDTVDMQKVNYIE